MLRSRPALRPRSPRYLWPLLFLWLAAQAVTATGQTAFKVQERYTKYQLLIPMRDGVRLFTHVYIPKDTSKSYPILLLRTPYSVGPYEPDAFPGSLGPSPQFAEEGYIFAYQDVRGRMMSEGEFVNMRPQLRGKAKPTQIDESTDTYDTIEFLTRCLPNNNGRVGMWGISYPGFYAAAGVINSHPALKAVSPQAPIADWFLGDDFHHNGAFFLLDAFSFLSGFGPVRPKPSPKWTDRIPYTAPDAYKFYLETGPLKNFDAKILKGRVPFWNEMMQHPNYDGYWQARNLLPHLKNVKAAVMTVGGWYDAEDLHGPLKIYREIERENPGIHNTLVMGPWPHGGWSALPGDRFGDFAFGQATSQYFQESVQLPFFNTYLKDKGASNLPEALVFVTGADTWKSFDAWPPRNVQPKALYFQPGKRLRFEPSKETAQDSFDSYLSDPANPVPYVSGVHERRKSEYMNDDQRFAAARPDVLTYQTDPLTEPMTLMGPITANLYVSTTGTDADFVVKVIDVYPDDGEEEKKRGYQRMVRAEVMRARFRKSFSKPEALKPGQVTPVRFELQDVCHTFQKGHRLMVQVQSSWFPLVDRNPQTFVDIYTARESDFQKATHQLHRSASYPSRIEFGVITP